MIEHDLNERLLALDAQRIQMEANLNAIAGAIQECRYWLSKVQQSAQSETVT